ncbi:esterase [Mycobacterium sp. IS-1742]|uniref:alpha/beta hydrolase n=1 Tax=Mycobacterium sp. IS-1742 TaxID=1772285 RepID=UPI0007403B69|nr:alpha/beta hydrolase [Mycobacterium sp. IS-1742]KUI24675.1 esterase [Mycobacterium sp. IS-1742]
MNALEHARRVAADVTGVLPRAHAALRESGGWSPLSVGGMGRLGEVVLDEVTLIGMALAGPGPALPRTARSCAAAAEELSALGMDRAHADPAPLRVEAMTRRRFGPIRYERVTFEHDPSLPDSLAAEGFGGPATAVAHLCRTGDERRPWLVWVHGAGQGQPLDLAFSRARRLQDELGINVALPVQPGHGSRRTAWPPYPNMDPLANVAGVMRSVSEVRALVRWLLPQSTALVVSGVSMGSPVAALVSHFEESVDAVALYTPIFGLNAMIAHHLDRWGPAARDTVDLLRGDTVSALTSVVNLLATEPSPPPEHRLIVGAWDDRMAMRDPAIALHERWGGELYWHRGSHVGHIFSRGVQKASERFLLRVVPPGIDDTDAPAVSG